MANRKPFVQSDQFLPSLLQAGDVLTDAAGNPYQTGASSGTVTNVTGPSIFTWTNPTTTPTATINPQSGNKGLFSPSDGSSGTPTFRILVAADIPNLSAVYDVAGLAAAALVTAEAYTDSVAAGKLGTALTSAHIFVGNGSNAAASVAVSGVIAISNTGATTFSSSTGSGAVVLTTSPTIVTPTIASFVNATHNHQNAAGGGTLAVAAMARSLLITDVDGSTITFDVTTISKHIVTLAGSRTLAITNDVDGQGFSVILQQGSGGSHTVTWWSGISWQGGTVPTLSTAAGKRDIFSFIRVGSGDYIGFATLGY